MKNKQTNVGSFVTTKLQANSRRLLAALVAVVGFSMIALSLTGCDDGGGNGGGGNPQTATYTSKDGDGTTYTLKFTEAAARYAAQIGDTYELTIGSDKSTGTITNVSGSTLTLKPSNASKTFTVTVSGEGLTGLNGTVTWTSGDEDIHISLTLTPVSSSGGGTAPTVITASLPSGTVGTAYSATLAATGDTPITWSIDTGTLPGGLTLSTAGLISGTPTTAGTSNFTVKATNAKESGTKALSIVIAQSGGGDIMTWTAVTDSTFGTVSIYAIAHNGLTGSNSKWVAGGSNDQMAYSTNGVNLTAVADSAFGTSGNAIYAIAYGGGKFVAAGSSGKMAYSDDGVTWTAVADNSIWDYQSVGTTRKAGINAIAYGGGKFVAVGNEGKMAYSDDGITWTAVADSTIWEYQGVWGQTVAQINTIAYGGNRFVAGASQGKMAYSSDGINWTAVADSALDTTTINGIAYGSAGSAGGRFVAVGLFGRTAYSADNGVTWTAVENSTFYQSFASGYAIYGIAFGNGRFVATGSTGRMAYSPDGVTWTRISNTTIGSAGTDANIIRATAYGNGKFVAVSGGGKMAYCDW